MTLHLFRALRQHRCDRVDANGGGGAELQPIDLAVPVNEI